MSPLATVLADLDVSQGELARRSGLTRRTVWDAYHGRPCSLASWVRIAKALGVPLCTVSREAAEELRGLIVA